MTEAGGIRIALLTAKDETELLDFELQNRDFFARTVDDRGDEYFASFRERHRSLTAENESGTSMLFIVRDEYGQLVGRVNIVDIREESPELGYRIAESAAGRGYARTAVRMALEEAAKRGVARVIAMTTTDNVASRRVLEANGFEELPDGGPAEVEVNGESRPAVHFSRTLAGDGRAGIDADLVRRLIAGQFPQWSHLPVEPVGIEGWDNRTYRLGDERTVRLPTAAAYAPAVEKEHRWLPVLGPLLPKAVPISLALGAPAEGYPFSWSVRGWLDGETASPERVDDMTGFATEVAEFILALQRIDATDGPAAGAHSFHRGAPPAYYDDETRRSLAALDGRIDTELATAVWEAALGSPWQGPPVWFHGDIAHGNLLVRDGRLVAIIDFGTSGVGDPACDLVIAWTMFSGDTREAFRRTVNQDAGTWARARGWALWKALITLADDIDTDPARAAVNHRVIGEILQDHNSNGSSIRSPARNPGSSDGNRPG